MTALRLCWDEIERLPRAKRVKLLALLEQRDETLAGRLFDHIYPLADSRWDGPDLLGGLIRRGQVLHSRDKYPRHMEFFAAGATHRERCAMCANRVGKTFGMGGYEMAAHLTGRYPDWWPGRRFDGPVSAWAAGKGYETTRDIMQMTLLGSVVTGARKYVDGRGIVPAAHIGQISWKSGVADLVDTVSIRHVSGGWSSLGFKSYEQGRGSFEGTGKHVIWLDEEPPMDVYGECLIRTATMQGVVMLTFTPLGGMSQVVLQFLPTEYRLDAT